MGSLLTKQEHRDTAENYMLIDVNSPHVRKIIEAREKLTGWERLKLVFSLNEYGEVSPEIQRIITATTIGMVVGALIGALGRGRIAHQNFIRSHTHEIFETPLEAKRKLQDTVTLGMGAGGYRVGWRVGAFTFMYMTTATAIQTYRGKMGLMDQVAGAGTAGFLYKFKQGPKASIAGLLFGSGLGLVAGTITLGVCKVTGISPDSANLMYYQTLAKREEKENAKIAQNREILRTSDRGMVDRDEMLDMAKLHDDIMMASTAGKEKEDILQKEFERQADLRRRIKSKADLEQTRAGSSTDKVNNKDSDSESDEENADKSETSRPAEVPTKSSNNESSNKDVDSKT